MDHMLADGDDVDALRVHRPEDRLQFILSYDKIAIHCRRTVGAGKGRPGVDVYFLCDRRAVRRSVTPMITSLVISLPTMVVGFARYSRDRALQLLARTEPSLLPWRSVHWLAHIPVRPVGVVSCPDDFVGRHFWSPPL